MRRETQNLLLVLLGGALLKIAFNGTYLRYVQPALLPWLVAAGLITVLLGMFAIVRDIRIAEASHPAEGDQCATGSGDHVSRSPWMLLLPVFAIFLVAPPALGADSVGRAGDRVAVPAKPENSLFDPLPPGPAPALKISEFVTRVVWDDSGALNGRPVRLRGFLVQPDDADTVQLARMRVSCCAADAAPVKVDLAGPAAGAATALDNPSGDDATGSGDTWVEVIGTLRPGTASEANGQVPTFDVTLVRPIPAPSDPYEY